MVPVTPELLDEVVRRLVDTFHPERIYLFGSHAWGTPGPDSDVDLMVVVRDSDESPARRDARGHLALWDIGVAKDIMVKTHEEFERFVDAPAALENQIAREGKLLYAA